MKGFSLPLHLMGINFSDPWRLLSSSLCFFDGRTEIQVFGFPSLDLCLLLKWIVAYDVPSLASHNLKWAANSVSTLISLCMNSP